MPSLSDVVASQPSDLIFDLGNGTLLEVPRLHADGIFHLFDLNLLAGGFDHRLL